MREQSARVTYQDLQEATGEKQLRALLALASYAPSVHNTQPWKVAIHSPQELTLSLDQTRATLPAADPTGRGAYMALGAFAETFHLAAQTVGLAASWIVTSRATDGTVIRITLANTSDKTDSTITDAIGRRATFRQAMQAISAPQETREKLQRDTNLGNRCVFIDDKEKIRALAELIREGTALAYHDQHFRSEHADWIRNNWTRTPDGIPGYAIGIPTPLSFILPFLIRTKDVSAVRATQEYEKALSTPLFALITAQEETPTAWIDAGADLARLLISATVAGFVTCPSAAAIEMGDLAHKVAEIAGCTNHPQLLVRIGKGINARRLTQRRSPEAFVEKKQLPPTAVSS